ncbi:IS3 family transposase [Comamonas sp. 23]
MVQLSKGLQDSIHNDNLIRLKLKLKGLGPIEYRTQASSL